MTTLAPCTRPTLYFIGVSTSQSSIMKVFPKWAEVLDLDAEIRGYDAPLHADAEAYRRIVHHIRTDELARGALVTSHKISLLNACRDQFDELDPFARLCGEVSCIAKDEDRLVGHAKDPISSKLAWQAFVPAGWFGGDAEVLCLGAGGAAIALSVAVTELEDPRDRPVRMDFVNLPNAGFEHLADVHDRVETDVDFAYHLHDAPEQNDALVARLPAGSVVINATGMGKDRPGSPLTPGSTFPERGIAWELNYRGELAFLEHARSQAGERHLIVEDGWTYFLHGWTQVMAEVFDIDLTDEQFRQLDRAASRLRP